MEQEFINSFVNTMGDLVDIVHRQDAEIKSLQSALLSLGDTINNHDEGIKLILEILKNNGLIDY